MDLSQMLFNKQWFLSPGSEAGVKGMKGFAKYQRLQDDRFSVVILEPRSGNRIHNPHTSTADAFLADFTDVAYNPLQKKLYLHYPF